MDPTAPLVALAFKLQESRFGQLTYMRLYQGTLRRGDMFYNVDKKERMKVCAASCIITYVCVFAPHRPMMSIFITLHVSLNRSYCRR